MFLDAAPLDSPLKLKQVNADSHLAKRLAELGLRCGTPIKVALKTSGGGRIIYVNGSRVALGADLVKQMEVEAL